jgi:hypothetical protein
MKSLKIIAVVIFLSLLGFQNCSNRLITANTPVIDYSSVQSVMPDCEFNQIGLVQGETVKAYQTSTVPADQACRFEIRTCNNGLLTGSYQYGLCRPGAPAACLLDGKTIPHNNSIKVYRAATLPFGEQCEANSEVRTCINGVLSGSFSATKCTTERAIDCKQSGETIPNTQAKRFYQTPTVPFGQNCIPETRVCTNGVLSGSFTYLGCQADGPKTCLVNGVTMQHLELKSFFDRSSVPYGQVCPTSLARTCNNGVVSGSDSFIYISCSVAGAADCLFNGEAVVHQASVKAYKYATVAYGQSCESSTEMRQCLDGKLGGTYEFSQCSMDPDVPPPPPPPPETAPCTTADGVSMSHGALRTLYKTNLIRGSDTCAMASNTEEVLCTNGVLNGSARLANCPAPVELLSADGGSGGSAFDNMMCPSGVKTNGLYPTISGDIDSLALMCATGLASNRNGKGGGTPRVRTCLDGKVLVGLRGQVMYGWIWMIQGICAFEDGTGQYNMDYDGTFFGNEAYTFYQVCKPGSVVNKLKGRAGGAIDAIQVECAAIGKSVPTANLDCLGEWVDQGCSLSSTGRGKDQFFIKRRKSGNGAECSYQDRQLRDNSRDCTPYYEGS